MDEDKKGNGELVNANPQDPSDGAEQQNTEVGTYSSVATAPTQKRAMVVIFALFIVGIAYYVFFMRTPSDEALKEKQKTEIMNKKEKLVESATPVTAPNSGVSGGAPAPRLPDPMPLTPPKPPEPPKPPVPAVPPTPFADLGKPGSSSKAMGMRSGEGFKIGGDSERNKKLAERRKASIMVFGGGAGASSFEDGEKDGGKDKDKDPKSKKGDKDKNKGGDGQSGKNANAGFLGFGNGALESVHLEKTKADQVMLTEMGDTSRIIAQGKVMNAVLETAINSDLPGVLRAMVTRDVYAESGHDIMVPKGSRVIGEYDSEVKDGQTRIAVNWTRLILPGGIDLAITSPGIDALGRAGVAGTLDNKFWTRMGNALLVSYIIPYAANKLAGVDKETIQTTSTLNSSGNAVNTTSGSNKAVQIKEATDKFNDIAKKAIESAFPTKPTITVDQGTIVNIFVQQDLLFPGATSSSDVVQ